VFAVVAPIGVLLIVPPVIEMLDDEIVPVILPLTSSAPDTLTPLALIRSFSAASTLATIAFVVGREKPVVVSDDHDRPGIAIEPSASRSAPVIAPVPSRGTESVSALATSVSVEFAQVLWMVVAVTTGFPAGSEYTPDPLRGMVSPSGLAA
jgi:hypothetical protein